MTERLTGVDALLSEARSVVRRLSPREALAEIERGAVLVDLRDSGDRAAEGTVPGSTYIPLSVVAWRAEPSSASAEALVVDPDTTLILMCNDGFSSSLAGAWLWRLGRHDVADIKGGFRAWRAAGLPVELGGS